MEMVTRKFEPKDTDELAIEVGDEVSVLRAFDGGWEKVKALKRSGSMKNVQGLEGFIPIECLRSKGSKNLLFVSANMMIPGKLMLNLDLLLEFALLLFAISLCLWTFACYLLHDVRIPSSRALGLGEVDSGFRLAATSLFQSAATYHPRFFINRRRVILAHYIAFVATLPHPGRFSPLLSS